MATNWPHPLARLLSITPPGGFVFNRLKRITGLDINFESRLLLYLGFFGAPNVFTKADLDPPTSPSTLAWDEPNHFPLEQIARLRDTLGTLITYRSLRGYPLAPIDAASIQNFREDLSSLPDMDDDPIDGWTNYVTLGNKRHYLRREAFIRAPIIDGDIITPGPVRGAALFRRADFPDFPFILICVFVSELIDEIYFSEYDIAGVNWQLVGSIDYPSLDAAGINADDPRPSRAVFNESGTEMATLCSFSDTDWNPMRVVRVTIAHGQIINIDLSVSPTFTLTPFVDVTHDFSSTKVLNSLDILTRTLQPGSTTELRTFVLDNTSDVLYTYKRVLDVDYVEGTLHYVWIEGSHKELSTSFRDIVWPTPAESGNGIEVTISAAGSVSKEIKFKLFSSVWETFKKSENQQLGIPDTGEEGFLLDEDWANVEESAFDSEGAGWDRVVRLTQGTFPCAGFKIPCIQYANARTGVIVIDYSHYTRHFQETIGPLTRGQNNTGAQVWFADGVFTYITDTIHNERNFVSRPVPPNTSKASPNTISVGITQDLDPDILKPLEVSEFVAKEASSSNTTVQSILPEIQVIVAGTPLNVTTPANENISNELFLQMPRTATIGLATNFVNYKIRADYTTTGVDNKQDQGLSIAGSLYQRTKDVDNWVFRHGYDNLDVMDDIHGNVVIIYNTGRFRIETPESLAEVRSRLYVNGIDASDPILFNTDPTLLSFLINREYFGIVGPVEQLQDFIMSSLGKLNTIARLI